MTLDANIKSRLSLPAICAPMARVSNPELVIEACKAGLIGALQPGNVEDPESIGQWLNRIRTELDAYQAEHPDARVGPLAVNTMLGAKNAEKWEGLTEKYGIEIFITMAGDPSESIRWAHDWGARVYHDVVTLRFAEKAISANADGLTAICGGGGGHAGSLSPLSFIPKLREMFDGTIILGGGVANGAGIRAAEILGADLAYLGTRFIATKESGAAEVYKQMLIDESTAGLIYTDEVGGLAASWLTESMRRVGLDPENLPERPHGRMGYDHLPKEARPWVTFWSAGHGVDLIRDIPSVAELTERMKQEYQASCAVPVWT